MPRKAPTLTKSQIKQIRANLARKATQLGNRLVLNGLGELKDHEGNPIELSAGQIKSIEATLKFVLPAQQEIDDTTEIEVNYDELRQQAEALKQQIIQEAQIDDYVKAH